MTSAETIAHALGRAKRSGNGWLTSCPVTDHGRGRGDRNPSLSIADGDHVEIVVQCHTGCDQDEVLDALRSAGHLSCHGHKHTQQWRPQPSRPHARCIDQERSEKARQIFDEAMPIQGTLAQHYLANRGITIDLPDSLRFHPGVYHRDLDQIFPAMVARVDNVQGRFIGFQATFLDETTFNKIDAPTKFQRRSRGPTSGGAVRLAIANDTVALVEGVEDALAVIQMTGMPAWPLLGTGGFTSFIPPKTVRRVILAPDNDETGTDIIFRAAERLVGMDFEVHVARPPVKDWCDLLAEFDERAAIREFDGEQARTYAEAATWRELFGRPV